MLNDSNIFIVCLTMKTFSLHRVSVSLLLHMSQMSFAQVFTGHSLTMCYVMYVTLLNNNKGFQLSERHKSKQCNQ